MRANGADLLVAVEGEALTGHGDQLAVDADAVVGSHFTGADAEVAGESDFGEGDHFSGVFAGESVEFNGGGEGGQGGVFGKDHLQAGKRVVEDEPRNHERLCAHHIDGFVEREQRVQLAHGRLTALSNGCEGGHVGLVLAGVSGEEPEAALACFQRMERRVYKQIFGHCSPFRVHFKSWEKCFSPTHAKRRLCGHRPSTLIGMALPPKLIAVDIDGTLLPSDGTVISERNCRALLEAEAAGIQVVIATGRRQAYAAPLIGPTGLKASTVMITSNGTVTRTLGDERGGG